MEKIRFKIKTPSVLRRFALPQDVSFAFLIKLINKMCENDKALNSNQKKIIYQKTEEKQWKEISNEGNLWEAISSIKTEKNKILYLYVVDDKSQLEKIAKFSVESNLFPPVDLGSLKTLTANYIKNITTSFFDERIQKWFDSNSGIFLQKIKEIFESKIPDLDSFVNLVQSSILKDKNISEWKDTPKITEIAKLFMDFVLSYKKNSKTFSDLNLESSLLQFAFEFDINSPNILAKKTEHMIKELDPKFRKTFVDIVNMGFPPSEQLIQAVQLCNGNAQEALDHLLNFLQKK
ncbi:hypothetical protein M0811_02160 [Anaeramoeba ignava]|uniref:UBA domain-containing protein n=1 Tax=Anaeramoeba ignava TaxID=1746090 RepID=A0A9Q0LE47_ANAIG|nr:hypothetical protein M0811_02160 [Anaeramoeba ignava]